VPLFILAILKLIKLENKLKKYSPIIGKLGTLAIITYIFSLKDLRTLLNPELENILWKIIILVISFYIIIYFGAWIISSLLTKNKEEKFALFWNLSTRFITLGLIIGAVYAYYLNDYKITAVFLISYFIQIGLSAIIVKFIKK
jgi:predicted Na+-dependent transporter